MSNYIFIQTSSLSNYYLEREFEAFSNIPNTIIVPFGIIPFTSPSIITGLDDFNINIEDKVFIRGGTLLASKNFIIPNNPNLTEVFKQNIYHNDIGFNYNIIYDWYLRYQPLINLLNNNVTFSLCKDVKDLIVEKDTFFKPNNDLKDFAGVIVPANNTLSQLINNTLHHKDWDSSTIFYTNEILDIVSEIRCFIVKEKLVTASYYRVLGKLVNIQVSENLQQTLSQIIPDYIPDLNSGNFVIDLAELADGSYRVIEYNCLNCSGLYSIDPIKLVEAIFNE